MGVVKDLNTHRQQAPARALKFFQTVDLTLAGPALDEVREFGGIQDEVYRIFHRSFKMYGLQSAAISFAGLMFKPLPGTPPTKGSGADPTVALAEGMRTWHLDEMFVDLFEKTAATVFSLSRNETSAWREDARQLVAGFTVVREVALASLAAMDRMSRGEGFLFEPGPLDSTDALFLEVWTGVGGGLRYLVGSGQQALEDECRAALKRPR